MPITARRGVIFVVRRNAPRRTESLVRTQLCFPALHLCLQAVLLRRLDSQWFEIPTRSLFLPLPPVLFKAWAVLFILSYHPHLLTSPSSSPSFAVISILSPFRALLSHSLPFTVKLTVGISHISLAFPSTPAFRSNQSFPSRTLTGPTSHNHSNHRTKVDSSANNTSSNSCLHLSVPCQLLAYYLIITS